MSQDFDLALLAELAESTSGSTLNYVNYGEVWLDNVVRVSYNKDAKRFDKVEYDGKPLQEGEHIEFQLHQEVTKKDYTTFTKTWFVDKRKSGRKATDRKDWDAIIRPSAVKVFGSEAAFFKAMSKRPLCAVEDYATGKTRTGTNRNGDTQEYDVTAPKFLAVFANEAEMKKDQDRRFKKAEASNGSIPVEIIGQVRGLLKSYNNDVEAVKADLKDDDDFNIYPIDELIAEAQKPPF